MYSSKYNLIRFSLKLTEFCLGSAFISKGGFSSFGPPSGIPLFAHCVMVIDSKKSKRK